MNRNYQEKHFYRLIESKHKDEIHAQNGGTSYGIISETEPTFCVLDISTDINFVSELVRKCNDGNLSPMHLKDVIEDALL